MAEDSELDDRDITGKFDGLRDRTRDLTTGSNAFARAITAAFAAGASGAKSFDTVLKSLALRLSNLSVNMALKPAIGALSGASKLSLGGLFTSSGVSGAADTGSIQPFAAGGVIGAPTYFPVGRGGAGLAGEAGPEAIMPLARGPDGRLGVAAAGGVAPNVTVNIATPDAESFRRSDVYLTGLIARAVARGQRGL